MRLTQVDIKNFRGINELSLNLNELCVLIGENNAGKSSVLDAVRCCLAGSLSFADYDYHLAEPGADPTTAAPIKITLTFAESALERWPDDTDQALVGVVQFDEDDLRVVALQATSQYSAGANDHVPKHEFLDLNGKPLSPTKSRGALGVLRRNVPVFHLSALRDAVQAFHPESPFWGPFVKSLELDDESRAELEKALLALNDKIMEGHKAFGKVRAGLGEAAKILPHGDATPVLINALPSRVFDLLSRTQVTLASQTGAHIPLARHGGGTQSVAVLCLFDAFLRSYLKARYGEHAAPILALEEPEAHLHPAAAAATGKMLRAMSGQKLISTHSGDLLASVPFRNIRRLRRRNGKITAHQPYDEFTAAERKRLDYHIRATRGSLLFSRCWLLVEGETEALLLAGCARALGCDLYADGVSCVEFSKNLAVDQFIRLADSLGIEWFLFVDGDDSGKRYARAAQRRLQDRERDGHIRAHDHASIELLLCRAGYGDVYQASIAAQKRDSITAAAGTPDYWSQVLAAQGTSKPRNALRVAEKIAAGGESGVPAVLHEVIERVREQARGAG